MTPEQARALSGSMADSHPQEILEAALSRLDHVAVSTSLGATAVVMLHLAARATRRPDVLFVDTGYHFAETVAYGDQLADLLGLSMRVVRPRESVAEHEELRGPLFATDPDRCCALRKVSPLDEMLTEYDGWVTGVRRRQTADRGDVALFAVEPLGQRTIVKVAPLAHWTEAEIDAYVEQWRLPVSPLVARGYRSIGCEPCTSRTSPGEDPRAGRWSDFSGKTECGLHLSRAAALDG